MREKNGYNPHPVNTGVGTNGSMVCTQTARYNQQSIHKGVGTNSGESGARNLEAESIRSRAKSTGGCVKLKIVTEIRERKALEDSHRDKTKKGPTCRRFPGRCP